MCHDHMSYLTEGKETDASYLTSFVFVLRVDTYKGTTTSFHVFVHFLEILYIYVHSDGFRKGTSGMVLFFGGGPNWP